MENRGREGSRISREVGQARHSDSERGIIITCRGGDGGNGLEKRAGAHGTSQSASGGVGECQPHVGGGAACILSTRSFRSGPLEVPCIVMIAKMGKQCAYRKGP